jgi:hypothetical protein
VFYRFYVILDCHRTRHILAFVHFAEPTLSDELKQFDLSLLDDEFKIAPFLQKLIELSDFHSAFFINSVSHGFFASQLWKLSFFRGFGVGAG